MSDEVRLVQPANCVILQDNIRREGPTTLIIPLLCPNPGDEDHWAVKKEVQSAAQMILPTCGLQTNMGGRPVTDEERKSEAFAVAGKVVDTDKFRWYAEWRCMKGL